MYAAVLDLVHVHVYRYGVTDNTDSIHSIQMRPALNFGPVFDCTVVQPLPLLEWRLRRPESFEQTVIGPIWRAGTPPSVRFVWDKPPPRPVGASLGRGKLALALGEIAL